MTTNEDSGWGNSDNNQGDSGWGDCGGRGGTGKETKSNDDGWGSGGGDKDTCDNVWGSSGGGGGRNNVGSGAWGSGGSDRDRSDNGWSSGGGFRGGRGGRGPRRGNIRGGRSRGDYNRGNNSRDDDGWGSSSNRDNDNKGDSGWGSSRDNDSRGENGWGSNRGRAGRGRGNNGRSENGWNSAGSDENRGNRNRDGGDGGWGNDDWGSKGGDDNRSKNRESKSWGDDGWGSGGNSGEGNRGNKSREGSNGGWSNDGWGSDKHEQNEVDKNGDKKGWGSSSGHDDNNRGNKSRGDGGWGSGGGENSVENRGFKRSHDSESPNKKWKSEDGAPPEPFKPDEINLDEEAQLQIQEVGENFYQQKEIKVTCLPKDHGVEPIETFDQIITSKLLLDNIKSQKYQQMTPIQKWAIPAIANGLDMIACAQTGSGKTAAFLLPVMQTLLTTELEPNDPNGMCQHPYCLIISPTRELANQIYVHAMMLSRDSILKCHVIYGQVSSMHLRSKLSTGCHILVATPGKLKDFLDKGWIGFKNIKYIILDEGDRLVGDGFKESIDYFINHETMSDKKSRQVLFFSATFHLDIQLIAKSYFKNFVILSVGRIGAANEAIKQEFLQVNREDKKRELKKILQEIPEEEKAIVFTQTKTCADMLAGFFNVLNLTATSIHGDRHQSQRDQAIKAFRRGEKRFLISSPVGNRGLDLPKVALVINYDLPSEIDEYVHRIGRTGRAGHNGRAISFYDSSRDSDLLKDLIPILKEAKQEIPEWMEGTSNGFGDSNPEFNSENDTPATNNAENPSTAPQEDLW